MTVLSASGNNWQTSLCIHLLTYTSLYWAQPVIGRLHYAYICWRAPAYLHITAEIFPQCRFSRLSAKATGYSKRYWAQPRVGVLARSWCISQKNQVDFEQVLKLDESIDFPDGKYLFMGSGVFKTLHQFLLLPLVISPIISPVSPIHLVSVI